METRKKVTISTLKNKKNKGEKAVFITAYDFPAATFANKAGVDMILVGDSGAMCLLGYQTTNEVSMDEMIMMTNAVIRGNKHAFVVGDMPFLSYQISNEIAVSNAGRFIKSGCDAIKLEGGVRMVERVRAITDSGIAVMGHIGLTPQNMAQMGGYKIQGKDIASFNALVEDAKALEKAGAFSILLEGVTNEVAEIVKNSVSIPCYGIGAGVKLDGQLIIMHDILGTFVGEIRPKFIKVFDNIGDKITEAISQYATEVRNATFPAEEHFYPISDEALSMIKKTLG
ncbi:3-methyl-2-oxobutanoate hydroxymethyltransferase [Candidatus Deianiraea vastatrix]|uniref:3-methyl-2-oxobutanoate hydroxymethyltransferase n=1 Tax=Candidatus Deianiraea vastatrix TaxID=2163644 RepID=A0A5B8XJ20_9RICK|nr:3-methyl-2-oxobutanoate hydroxymethyltransferase [Candidatus Deianiraea vastatrix]QED23884.1 3-methyl-2-oxobutanoate hydroxymethyltransferase [Candidatus Deianiraea vastatrix]